MVWKIGVLGGELAYSSGDIGEEVDEDDSCYAVGCLGCICLVSSGLYAYLFRYLSSGYGAWIHCSWLL